MTKPKELEKLRRDRGWSKQELADRIYDVTHIRVHVRTLQRFIEQIGRPTDVTQDTIDKFMKQLRGGAAQELSR